MTISSPATRSRLSGLSQTGPWWPSLALLLIVLCAYVPAMRGGFVWDDDDYVTENDTLTTLDGLSRIWSPGHTPQYYPLVFTTFWLEYHIWEVRPFGYHLVNVLLHVLNAVLLWRLLRRLSVPAAWCCAALFALHPVQVESVAWITERKNVLSGAFYLLSLSCFLRFEEGRQRRWYFGSFGLFVLALLSKTVSASLPIAILLIHWWRKRRMTPRFIAALLPFVLTGAAMGLLTVWLERHHVGAEGQDWALSWMQRVLIAGRALWLYAGKLFWPHPLIFVYPRWEPDASRAVEWAAPLFAAVTLIVLYFARHRIGRGPFAAVAFFVVTLTPALGFFDVFPFRYSFVADHFQYLASIGLIVLSVAGAAHLLRARRRQIRTLAVVLFILILPVLGAFSRSHTEAFESEESLWVDTLRKNDSAWMAHFNLGLLLEKRGDADGAADHYRDAVRLRPQHHKAHTLLARYYTERSDLDRAAEHYRVAIEVNPAFLPAVINLGSIYASQGRSDLALKQYGDALAARSPQPEVNALIGNVYLADGRPAEAVEQYRQALRCGPDDAVIRTSLGLALMQMGELEQAVPEFQKALAFDETTVSTRLVLSGLQARTGDYAQATGTLRAGMDREENDPQLSRALAWILATCPDDAVRDGAEAVRLAEGLSRGATDSDPGVLNTLAVAYAEVGRFGDALRAARQAHSLARALNDARLVRQIERELSLFEQGRPYRTAPSEDSIS